MGEVGKLIERLEGAAEGSRKLDALLAVLVLAPEGALAARSRFNGEWCVYLGERNGEPKLWQPHGRDGMLIRLPFTTSLDAALTLAERVLPGEIWTCEFGPSGSHAEMKRSPFIIEGSARTPALALCAAILKAHGASQ